MIKKIAKQRTRSDYNKCRSCEKIIMPSEPHYYVRKSQIGIDSGCYCFKCSGVYG